MFYVPYVGAWLVLRLKEALGLKPKPPARSRPQQLTPNAEPTCPAPHVTLSSVGAAAPADSPPPVSAVEGAAAIARAAILKASAQSPASSPAKTFVVAITDEFHFALPEHETYVGPFSSFAAAVAYAKARTRSSVEELRKPGQTREELRQQQGLFGESAFVMGGNYSAHDDVDFFVDHPATRAECDWRALQGRATESLDIRIVAGHRGG